MPIVIEVASAVEARLRAAAAERGLAVHDYVRSILEREVLPLAVQVAGVPPEDQDRILAAAADAVADLYESDLARPMPERELTAFTALDGEGFHDGAEPI